MQDLKAIYVNGEATLIFDNDLNIVNTMSKEEEVSVEFDVFLNTLLDDGKFTPEERAKVLDMTVREFAELCRKAASRCVDKTPATSPAYDNYDLLHNPGKIVCPLCGHQGLRQVDGHVICPGCNHDFGDIDDLM